MHNPNDPIEFTTYVKVNTALTDLIAKLGTWYDPRFPGLVRITSHEHSAPDATLRALRLFQKLGLALLVQNHTTVPAATADEAAIRFALI